MITDDALIAQMQHRFGTEKQFKIKRRIPDVLSGEVIVVDEIKEGRQIDRSYAYMSLFDTRIFSNLDEFLRWIGDASGRRQRKGILSYIQVSSVIAVLIALTICMLVTVQIIRNVTPNNLVVPDILSNALTTILGFYFGAKVTEAKWTNPPTTGPATVADKDSSAP